MGVVAAQPMPAAMLAGLLALTFSVDTDVQIWYLSGSVKAVEALGRLDSFGISAVTYHELVEGMRSKEELRTLRGALAQWGIGPRMIDAAVSARAVFYVERHVPSHAPRLADAVFAATAAEDGVPLLTASAKHFRPLRDVAVEVFRP